MKKVELIIRVLQGAAILVGIFVVTALIVALSYAILEQL